MTSGTIQALGVMLPMAYMLAAILHGMAFGGNRAPQVAVPRTWSLRTVIVLHALYVWAQASVLQAFPVTDLWSTLSAVAFCTTLFYATIARWIGHPGTGGVVLGAVLALQFIASALGPIPITAHDAPADLFSIIHVSTTVIAVSALVLSGIHGLLYLVLYRQMREKRFGPLFDHLPDLSLLAKMTRRAAFIGFVALTVGLNVGIGISHAQNVEGFHYTDPGVLLTILLWIHFGVIAFSRFIYGFTARRASWAAAAGLVALLVTLAVTLLPNVTFHSQS